MVFINNTTSGIVIAFDFGLKHIGVAIGNTLLKCATPFLVLHEEKNQAKFNGIAALLQEWQPILCVVGLPCHPDGAPHAMTARCQRFANQLRGRFGVGVVLEDERYSSVTISLRKAERVDAMSAALILQQYFNQRQPAQIT